MTKRITLEICVDSADSMFAAIEGGADRIELCSALELGGLTPTPGLMHIAASASVPVFAMIRPRGGDYVFSPAELDQMHHDIEAARKAGLAGVVIGANDESGKLDGIALGALKRHAGSLDVTLNRAIDLTPDPVAAVETAASLGFRRILSSGGALTCPDGLAVLRLMHERAKGRLTIMPGSGVSAETAGTILGAFPVTEIHGSCSLPIQESDSKMSAFGFSAGVRRRTSRMKVERLRAALDS
jgi:copper homeostasis protein